MKVSISVEQFLAGDLTVLKSYLEQIIAIHKTNKNLSIHFDYFVENQKAFDLVKSFANQIDIDLHLMSVNEKIYNFKTLSKDVRDVKSINSEKDGIVFDLGTEIYGYENLIKESSTAIVMTIKCGKSGQAMIPSQLSFINQIKNINPKIRVIVDGGVNDTNIDIVKNAGADVVVVGNYAKKAYENGELAECINRLLRT